VQKKTDFFILELSVQLGGVVRPLVLKGDREKSRLSEMQIPAF
jgi:hypothetical protein